MLSKKAKSIKAYTAGEQPEGTWIKLNTNENPYPPSIKTAGLSFDLSRLKLYPDPDSISLLTAIAAHHGIATENVFAGNGSDEVLALGFAALFDPDAPPVLAPDITYSFYPVYAELFEVPYKQVPLTDSFEINVDDYKIPSQGVVFANPNAPTSVALDKKSIIALLEYDPGRAVIVDEAYADFFGESMIPYIKQYKNLVVVRTMSKSFSLAGLRLGYAVADGEVVSGLSRIKDSFNSYPVDYIAQNIARAAFEDIGTMEENCKKIVETRERFSSKIRGLKFCVLPSRTNFVFVSHPDIKAKVLFEELKKRKILVRYFNKPRIDNFLRITIGTDREMDEVMSALSAICR